MDRKAQWHHFGSSEKSDLLIFGKNKLGRRCRGCLAGAFPFFCSTSLFKETGILLFWNQKHRKRDDFVQLLILFAFCRTWTSAQSGGKQIKRKCMNSARLVGKNLGGHVGIHCDHSIDPYLRYGSESENHYTNTLNGIMIVNPLGWRANGQALSGGLAVDGVFGGSLTKHSKTSTYRFFC